MSKYIVVVFPSEAKAYEGAKAVKALEKENSVTLYGAAVIAKDTEGKVEIKQSADEGPVGTAMGMLAGGVVGALAATTVPGLLLAVSGGGLIGSLSDLNNAGVGLDFAGVVGEKMDAGTAALIAEVEEYWTVPMDTSMEQLGGVVHRRTRYDFEDEQFTQEVQAWSDELDELDEEMEQASSEMQVKIKVKRDAVAVKLSAAADKASKKTAEIEQEYGAKVDKLESQLDKANDEAKAKIAQRMDSIKANQKARMEKLSQAGEHIKNKLAA